MAFELLNNLLETRKDMTRMIYWQKCISNIELKCRLLQSKAKIETSSEVFRGIS